MPAYLFLFFFVAARDLKVERASSRTCRSAHTNNARLRSWYVLARARARFLSPKSANQKAHTAHKRNLVVRQIDVVAAVEAFARLDLGDEAGREGARDGIRVQRRRRNHRGGVRVRERCHAHARRRAEHLVARERRARHQRPRRGQERDKSEPHVERSSGSPFRAFSTVLLEKSFLEKGN